MTATEDVLAFAAAPHAIPAVVAGHAVRLLGDTLACGFAGSGAPGADGVYAAASRMGAGDDAPVLGRGLRLPAPGAAMVNGFQIHCLEWDAVHEPAVVHAMSVVTAALHAACHRVGGVSDDEALAALCVGVEVACLLGVAATSGLRFFRPATAGVMGAALAVARVEGLPAERFGDVLGLAYSQAAGTMQAHVEGSIALPLQVALAARAAVTAVDLVHYDLSGPRDVLEGPFGYFRLFDEGSLAGHADGLGRQWRIVELSVKPFPSGRASHATLGMLHALGAAKCAALTAIEARVPPLIARLVGRPWVEDMTTAYARLCLPFLVALMLTDGRIDPRRFTAANFNDPELRRLGAMLRVVVDDNPDPNALFPQDFTLRFADGQSEQVSVPVTLGAPDNPLGPARQAEKLAFALSLAATPPDAATRAALFDNPLSLLAGRP
ncbi:MmgE/PrpD family protein [Sandaracinobacteroides saxicola]|uniref:MmgE/PrpD family protein n=1 Tax=Sandaracinobacteroides saxicola TaxID=2759707 RepID=A0A7G5IJA6_9SPHN|nr:MmgE/PrpD family protein [Sandaracinobacteroides saxicola]QMW23448.1 MmgE/PrpD family protein [Sandaracinobacteroides saxicola]